MKAQSMASKRRALEACAKASRKAKAAEEAREVALDGRLLELDNPVLLRIARQADLRTLVALEGTSRRLNALSKEAGDYGAIRQLYFATESAASDRRMGGFEDTVLTAIHKEPLARRGLHFRYSGPPLSGDPRVGKKRPRERLDGLLGHLLSRGARPISIHVTDVGERPSGFLSGSLKRLADDVRLSALQGFVQEISHLCYGSSCCPNGITYCRHEEVFAKRLSQLLGLACTDHRCPVSPREYPSLLYACLDHQSFIMLGWNNEDEEKADERLMRRLRCLVIKESVGLGGVGHQEQTKQRVKALSGGRLKLRSSSTSQLGADVIGRPLSLVRMAFACEDFDPAELEPLFLSHIWEEGLLQE